ncbi:putative glycosyl transferase [Nostoc sp. NIES-3756]|uniref:glycosyltransferase family 2 protein n=1 Tax=Nostoc sp. NIES-3756 TaxID=1751286 RepID=UPI00071EB736|nr:glycosyltransferase [Nostoc sp. NIES-3756]BAT55817.1 putative glycosyl transferase [Nostoc sp. NIES-3756]
MSKFAPWKILDIDLSEDIPELNIEPNYQGIYAVFWWRGIPLGDREIFASDLPLRASALRNLAIEAITPAIGDRLLKNGFKAPLPVTYPDPAWDKPPDFHALLALQQPLQQLQQTYAQPVNNSISVVICTRNRPEQLARCLRSLLNLSQPPQQIIVVDNAPSDDTTREIVAQIPQVQYVLEPIPGLSKARNTGIHHATGEIIAFTDDDVEVHPDWCVRLQQAFVNPQVLAVTGLMLPAELETEAQYIFHKGSGSSAWDYRAINHDMQFFENMKHRGVPVWRIGAGANMAFRRQAFELVGYFDERLGAGASGCSEDSEMWYRILAEGWICRYEPTSVVFHYHRRDIEAFKSQAYQYMRGHVTALLVQFANYQHWGNLRRLCLTLPKNYLVAILRPLKYGFSPRYSSVFTEILGCVSGIQFYLNNRKKPAWSTPVVNSKSPTESNLQNSQLITSSIKPGN